MSHELRTPMTAILGYADVLLADVHEPGAHEAAATIRRNGDCLLQLINDILDLSKIESGRLTTRRSRCSPAAVVADVLSLLRVRAEAKNVDLQMECRGPIPETICTDAARLRQILINLLGNAIKFTEQGSVRLIVEMSPAGGQPPRIEFQVVDTGIGMTEEQCVRLFERFTQVHGPLNEIYGGTGLGLAISKRLAEMLQGSIHVESQVGRGSTFTLTIDTGPLDGVPLLDSLCDAVAIIRRPESRVNPPHVRLDCRVLLAEDGPDNRRLIALFLRKANAEVTTAENGQVAVELAAAAMREGRPFDVILMDMQMPLVDGYEATRRLRVQGYRGPIVALTAHAMFDDRQKCLAAGCDDYVTKPVDRDGLLAAVLKQRQTPVAP
jgi:CheY-like chemotaxis protein